MPRATYVLCAICLLQFRKLCDTIHSAENVKGQGDSSFPSFKVPQVSLRIRCPKSTIPTLVGETQHNRHRSKSFHPFVDDKKVPGWYCTLLIIVFFFQFLWPAVRFCPSALYLFSRKLQCKRYPVSRVNRSDAGWQRRKFNETSISEDAAAFAGFPV